MNSAVVVSRYSHPLFPLVVHLCRFSFVASRSCVRSATKFSQIGPRVGLRWLAGLVLLFAAYPGDANPVGGTVVQGAASISSQGSQLTIQQTSPRAQVNWSSFNIGLGETTTFIQPSSTSLIWNRINDANASQILGNLNANGYVVLQNSAGFYIGGQAVISTHGLLMTTAPIPVPDLSAGGAWDFNSAPPAASIINYGQIQASGDKGGSVFLIAADIQNKAGSSISAPEGQIGLYDGKDVLISARPDGRGLSAKVILPQGSVNNEGKLIADAGTIRMNAQVVNQGGVVQANSVRQVNGLIELVASDGINLSAGSTISAQGDAGSANASQGGVVLLNSANTFADASGSTIDVSGRTAGHNGLVEIVGNSVTAGSLQSQINSKSASDFLASSGLLLINPQDITVSGGANSPSAANPNLNVGDLSSFSKLELEAAGNINVNAALNLSANQDASPLLSLTAGNAITLANGAAIAAGNNSRVNLSADTINLTAGSSIQAPSADIQLSANTTLNNQGQIVSDGGTITLQGQSVSQAGLVQANAVSGVSGAIEINADSTLDHVGQTIADGGAILVGAQNIKQGGLIRANAVGALSGNVALNAVATLNNQGQVIADAGTISMQAQTIAQFGLIQANGAGSANGSIGLLASGTINNQGQILGDGGVIQMSAPGIIQNGRIQANSVGAFNGLIELTASENLALHPRSVLAAHGDATSAAASPGGFVVLKSDRTFSDFGGSTIDISGKNGGHDGVMEVLGKGVAVSKLHSRVDGLSAAAYQSAGGLLLAFDTSRTTPADLTFSSAQTSLTADAPILSVDDLSSFSKIDLFASGNISVDLSSDWGLSSTADPHAILRLNAGNSIVVADGTSISAPGNWSVNLAAGPRNLSTRPVGTTRADGIYLDGAAFIQAQSGNIQLWAANEVQINNGDDLPVGNNGIRTLGGGSISVTTEYGDVNTGGNPQGYYRFSKTLPPYYSVSSTLGGISTKAGGDVNINAGGDVFSFQPNSSLTWPSSVADGGSGAFGPQPGNVTINAGGRVFGHYVVANGVGRITAQQDIGAADASENVALSLIAGSWTLNAPSGSIYLQEVRNPNGVFNNLGSSAIASYHLFDYSPLASVTLNAAKDVFLTGQNVPRPNDPVPVVLPPMLYINAGRVVLQNNMSLFPSPYQNLEIVTTGDFIGAPIDPSAPSPKLIMSDSPDRRWLGTTSFGDTDHPATPLQINNPNPVVIDVGGNMQDLVLIADKQARISVGKDMKDSGFAGENVHANDVTSIDVKGNISNEGIYHFVILDQAIQPVPAVDLPPGIANSWNTLFSLAVDHDKIMNAQVPSNLTLSQLAAYAHTVAPIGVSLDAFTYDPTTLRLGYLGQMGPDVLAKLSQGLTVLRYKDGFPDVENGHFVTDTITWADASSLATLSGKTQGSTSEVGLGYRLGGPGQFDIHANSINLGNTYGILSCGVSDVTGGTYGYGALASVPLPAGTPIGATLNVTVEKDPDSTTASLDMLTSTIASMGGGDLNVTSLGGSMNLGSQQLLLSSDRQTGFGLYTSGHGNVNVTAFGDIDVAGSRIGSYNGGNITVVSKEGNVNAGNGGASQVQITYSYVDPATRVAGTYTEEVYGSGIIANTLIHGSSYPGSAPLPGNITVETPHGSIYASLGGILQEALNGNLSAGPTITLIAGDDTHHGNIDLGDSGVIGGTIIATANGNINGLVISRQNSTINAAQSFSGVVLSGGSANLSAGGSISGTIVGVGGISASGGQGVSATLLSQNVSVAGAQAQSTLGTSSSGTSASQSAAQQANTEAQQQVGTTPAEEDDKKKNTKLPTLVRRVGRVTVILPPAP